MLVLKTHLNYNEEQTGQKTVGLFNSRLKKRQLIFLILLVEMTAALTHLKTLLRYYAGV